MRRLILLCAAQPARKVGLCLGNVARGLDSSPLSLGLPRAGGGELLALMATLRGGLYCRSELREECGIFGVAGDKQAAQLTRLGLHSLQHRGQDGAGIVTYESTSSKFHHLKGLGLTSAVFNNNEAFKQLWGDSAIGHVRYATTGYNSHANLQPLGTHIEDGIGELWVAHNGNFSNHERLRGKLGRRKYACTSDTELVLHLAATSTGDVMSRIVDACGMVEGAFSLVFLLPGGLLAARDPHGYRPLVMGMRANGAIVFASETCALEVVKAKFVREVLPGEVVKVNTTSSRGGPFIEDEGVKLPQTASKKFCMLELIYLSAPSSTVFGESVYKFRQACGKLLARECPPPPSCDMVVSVPDSGFVAALSYAREAGLPYEHAISRSPYVSRTFIADGQKKREEMVAMKLVPVREILEGKSIVLVDDSIVRGTTSAILVDMLREAGAREVHLRVASPPVVNTCNYGVNISNKEELIMNKCMEEVCGTIGVDSLGFLSLKAVLQLGDGETTFCRDCFTKGG